MTRARARPPARWRLLLDFDRPGAHHMAVDDALRAAFAPGRDRPLLRLYSWAPACLSLGYAQPSADIDPLACQRAGLDVVRRPTGGRAVLHEGELTYAVIAAIDDPLVGGTIARSAQAIAGGLVAGLRALGVAATLAPGSPGGDLAARRSGACFAAASRHEVLWRGRKLIGSAQCRRDGVFLQHGSLPLTRGRISLARLLRRGGVATLAGHLAASTTSVGEVLGQALTPAAAARRLAPAFAQALGLTLQPDDLTATESALAADLQRSRYANADWTARR